MFGLTSQLESMFLRIRSLFFISSFISFIGCGDNDLMTDYKMFKISGSAQGTSYSLQVFDTDLHFTQNDIDKLQTKLKKDEKNSQQLSKGNSQKMRMQNLAGIKTNKTK